MTTIPAVPNNTNPRWWLWLHAAGVNASTWKPYEYIIWINQRWLDWMVLNSRRDYNFTASDHAAFDKWLADYAKNAVAVRVN